MGEGEGLRLDLGVSEAREIDGFPHPHPRDGLIQMIRGRRGETGDLVPSHAFSLGFSRWHRWGREARRARLVQKVKFLFGGCQLPPSFLI